MAPLKSLLFSEIQSHGSGFDELKIDLENALSVPIDAFKSILAIQERIEDPSNYKQKEEEIHEYSLNSGIENAIIKSVLDLLSHFSSQLGKYSVESTESAENWASDIIALGLSTVEHKDRLEKISNIIIDYAQLQRNIRLIRSHEKGIFSYFSSYGATVEMRGVFDSRFDFGSDIKKYKPHLVGHVPVATIKIGVSDEKGYHFQIGKAHIRVLIDSLIATEKEMILLSSSNKNK